LKDKTANLIDDCMMQRYFYEHRQAYPLRNNYLQRAGSENEETRLSLILLEYIFSGRRRGNRAKGLVAIVE